MEAFSIIPVSPAETDTLAALSRKCFEQTFAPYNSAAPMAAYMDHHFSARQLSNELNDPNSRFYFITDGVEILGYLKINTGPAETEDMGSDALEIERIYVIHEAHGRKAGKSLMQFAIATGRHLHKKYIWLGVWEKNEKAIRFYEKFGWRVFGSHTFRLGDEEQNDLLMRLDLTYE